MSEAARLLAAVGLPRDTPVRALERDDRRALLLGGSHVGWVATNDAGHARLERERRVLELLAARCRFAVPRVVWVAPDGGSEVRTQVPSTAAPFDVWRAVHADPALARSIGGWLGAALAEQHAAVRDPAEVPWLPHRPEWPLETDWILAHLPRVVDDADLLAACADLLAAFDALPCDPVLVHGDVGFHNLGLRDGRVAGLFDYDGAAWADRHVDFRYLLLESDGQPLLDAALAIYEPATGAVIQMPRLHVENAACAVSFLAYRQETPPGERSCGRTLAEDLAWTRTALARVSGDASGGR
ncbi:MAG: aminoglycoside phosphotransferase family protein [Alphaproteobacteria bacterium]|nr:aminoglycoside phosphotransferase family protein [Alphaproteobacteria bacterium]